jgi:sugar (pentulose or hexulose) kinase
MDLLTRLYAQHTGLPVRTGSPEATALGNAIVQGIALGRWATLSEARAAMSTGDAA